MAAPSTPPAELLYRVLRDQGAALGRLASAWTRNRAERDDLMQDIGLLMARQRRRQADDELTDEHISSQPSPLARVEQEQRARHLQRAIGRLSEDHRAVLVLSFEGLSHEEIGDVVGASANAVGVRLHRARAALTDAMQTSTATPERKRSA